jgi:drug/metabolite transporter (DMT)-like permease
MKNKDWFLVILLGVFWGASFLFVEILLEYVTPFVVVYLRVAIASALLLKR